DVRRRTRQSILTTEADNPEAGQAPVDERGQRRSSCSCWSGSYRSEGCVESGQPRVNTTAMRYATRLVLAPDGKERPSRLAHWCVLERYRSRQLRSALSRTVQKIPQWPRRLHGALCGSPKKTPVGARRK